MAAATAGADAEPHGVVRAELILPSSTSRDRRSCCTGSSLSVPSSSCCSPLSASAPADLPIGVC